MRVEALGYQPDERGDKASRGYGSVGPMPFVFRLKQIASTLTFQPSP